MLYAHAFCAEKDSIPNRQYVFGLRQHYGFIFRHSEALRNTTVTTYPWGLEADFSSLLTDKKSWSYCSCFPRTGLTFGYINFNSPGLLGYALPLIGYIEPFLSYHNTFSMYIRFGAGLAYMSNPYDSINNPDNLFYSTHISFPVILGVGLNYRLNKHWNFRLAGSFNHISNGGIKNPNKGINYPTLKLGADYTFNPYPLPKGYTADPYISHAKWRYMIALGGSAKPTNKGKDKRYPVYVLSALISRQVGKISSISAGAEFMDDRSLEQLLDNKDIDHDHKRTALLIGHEMLIGRFIFSQRLGIYFYAPHEAHDPVYQRYGLTFNFSENIYAGVNLKAHRHIADLLDIRIGVLF